MISWKTYRNNNIVVEKPSRHRVFNEDDTSGPSGSEHFAVLIFSCREIQVNECTANNVMLLKIPHFLLLYIDQSNFIAS